MKLDIAEALKALCAIQAKDERHAQYENEAKKRWKVERAKRGKGRVH